MGIQSMHVEGGKWMKEWLINFVRKVIRDTSYKIQDELSNAYEVKPSLYKHFSCSYIS